ncbi:hypothetical protein WR25_20605 [Diploscapter pachys]|jgi:hypothetical protein|uniref:Cardiolipin synthase N-terminal domain-containing protein n=2 Tax=cellular organisms TaxID=131567 RepID=A0A2A2K545_9BILA|nr:hypothetical protein WR25_20605 [Diploscapter pachys]
MDAYACGLVQRHCAAPVHLRRGIRAELCRRPGIPLFKAAVSISGSASGRGSIMSDPVTYFWIALVAILLLVDLWAIISVFRSDKSDGVKVLWSLLLVVFPVVGLAIWGVAGPRGIKRGTGPTSPEHSKG